MPRSLVTSRARPTLFAGGLFNSAAAFSGLQVTAMLNHVMHGMRGIQLAGMFNWNRSNLADLVMYLGAIGAKKGDVQRYHTHHDTTATSGGITVSGLASSSMYQYGLQVSGLVIRAFRRMDGAQIGGLVSYAGDLSGFQVGTVNVANDAVGLQVGLVNVSRRIQGLQIGLINVATDNPLPFMVGVNGGFGSFERSPTGDSPPGERSVEIHYK